MNLLYLYRQYLYTLGYHPTTIQTKIRSIKRLETYYHIPAKKINSHQLLNYLEYLKKQPMNPNTLLSHKLHLSQYYTHLEQQKIIKTNPSSQLPSIIKRIPSSKKIILTQQEIQKLYQNTHTITERILLHLVYGCGLRALELENLNLEDIDQKNTLLIVQKGKNSKRRTIPLTSIIHEDLTHYLSQRKQQKTSENALLLNKKNNRLRKHTANHYLKQLIKTSKIKKTISLHNLRHSIASHLLEQNIPIEKISLFLGHQNIETTEYYTHLTNQQLPQ